MVLILNQQFFEMSKHYHQQQLIIYLEIKLYLEVKLFKLVKDNQSLMEYFYQLMNVNSKL